MNIINHGILTDGLVFALKSGAKLEFGRYLHGVYRPFTAHIVFEGVVVSIQ